MLVIPTSARTLNYGNPINRACHLNDGLVSRWQVLPARGKGNTFFDIAGKNHGTLTNGPTWTSSLGVLGASGGLDLDGTDDYVNCGTSVVPAGGHTFFLRITPDVVDSYQCLCAAYTGDGDASEIFINNAGSRLFGGHFSGAASADNSIAAGVPVNIGMTVLGGSTIQLYINGLASGTTSTDNFTTTAVSFQLGARNTTFPFNGKLFRADVYNRTLSASEMWGLHEDSIRGSPLTLNWLRPLTVFDTGGGGGGGTTARAKYLPLLGAA